MPATRIIPSGHSPDTVHPRFAGASFYGIIILMFYFDDRRHYRPHIHAQYGEFEAVISIDDGDVLEGDLPKSRMKLVQSWIEIHKDELIRNWRLAVKGQQLSKIEPLR